MRVTPRRNSSRAEGPPASLLFIIYEVSFRIFPQILPDSQQRDHRRTQMRCACQPLIGQGLRYPEVETFSVVVLRRLSHQGAMHRSGIGGTPHSERVCCTSATLCIPPCCRNKTVTTAISLIATSPLSGPSHPQSFFSTQNP